MECIYFPGLTAGLQEIHVTGDEARHLKVLNTKDGGRIMASNGRGLCAVGIVQRISKTDYFIKLTDFLENFGERSSSLGLALSILDSRERFEFAIEKAVELGATNIYPLVTKYTQKKHTDMERIKSKCVAALKQCRRARMPEISNPLNIDDLCIEIGKYQSRLVMDENGSKIDKGTIFQDTVVIIGPEGGFAGFEIEKLQDHGAMPINLGKRRLRAETAAIVALSFFSLV